MVARVNPSLSFHALLIFAKAAEFNSVRNAAASLKVSPKAVRTQIKAVEASVGQALFEGEGHALHLTSKGKEVHARVNSALSELKSALEHSTSQHFSGPVLTVKATPLLINSFLLPNMTDFYDSSPATVIKLCSQAMDMKHICPDVEVTIESSDSLAENIETLAELEVFPVCAPSFVQKGPLLLKDLQKIPLIMGDDLNQWQKWMDNAVTTVQLPSVKRLYLDNDESILAGAQAGLGIALTNQIVAHSSLVNGTLVKPFRKSLREGTRFLRVKTVDSNDGVKQAAKASFVYWLHSLVKT